MKFLVSSLSGKDNCSDISDYYDIIAPLDKLIMSFIAYDQPDRVLSVFYAFPLIHTHFGGRQYVGKR